MSKLINLQVLEAKNIICGVVEPKSAKEYGEFGEDFWRGIELDDAERAFIIPSHIIIGIFDDGSTKCAGIQSLNILNDPGNLYDDSLSNLFYYDTIIYIVRLPVVKSFVRYYQEKYETEEETKKDIYEDLLISGVKIDDETKNYLLG
jgi:hypothetical protein